MLVQGSSFHPLIIARTNELFKVYLRCLGQVESVAEVGGLSHVSIDQLL